MANSSDIIKEFLVSLGWKIDEQGQRKFATSIALQTAAAQQLAAGLVEAGRKVFEFAQQVAEGMEKLYFASQRTRSSVANIQALGFAAGQMGSTAEAAQASLENLARFLRTNPGGAGLLHSLGVQTADANGGLRDTSDILQDLGKRFAQMPYYRANAYAQLLGIDEKTLLALREGLGEFGSEYKDLLRAVGLDSQTAAKSSHEFMNALRGVRATFEVLAMKAASGATVALTQYTTKLREKLIQNLPWISEVLTRVIKGIAWISGMAVQLGGRVMDAVGAIVEWWNRLDGSSKALIATLGALVAAWRLLNVSFLLSPIGMITALGAAILLLYDDYKTWKEGGKSLIDWEKWEPGIQAAQAAIANLGAALKELAGLAHIDLNINFGGRDYVAYFTDTVNALAAAIRALPESIKVLGDLLRGDIVGLTVDLATGGAKGNWKELIKQAIKPVGPVPTGTSAPPTSGMPRGIRNNNPGNLNFAGQPGAVLESGPGARFAAFDTAQQGLNALAGQLRRYAQQGVNTIRRIVSKYAPPKENNTAAYIASVSRSLGIGADTQLNLGDPQLMAGLMGSIIQIENGRNPYAAEQIRAAASGPTNNDHSKQVVINQTNTTTVTGVSDAPGTARAVGDAMASANQLLIRNTKAMAY